MARPPRNPDRLTRTELTDLRAHLVEAQHGRCALCGEPFTEKNPAVVDHCHRTGRVRAALHRGCNAALGHVENNGKRYFLDDPVRLARWAGRLATYIHADYSDNPIYPEHRTAEEKAELRKARAKKARAAKKATA